MNAKKELLSHISHIGGRKVSFIKVAFDSYGSDTIKKIEGTLEEVLPLLDFDYYAGYGTQEVFGFIWYEDGTWSDRGEYDGSEWWQHQEVPDRNAPIQT